VAGADVPGRALSSRGFRAAPEMPGGQEIAVVLNDAVQLGQ